MEHNGELMNKSKELAKNTIILTVGKICTQFVSFMLLPLCTALLNPEEFGVVDLFNTYVNLLVPLFNWQFENGLFRFLIDFRSDRNKIRRLFSTVFITNIFQIIISCLFYMSVQLFISSEYRIFLLLDVVLNILQSTLLQFSRGLGNNSRYAFSSFLSASSAVILNVLFIAGFGMGAYGMFLATVIAKTISIVYLSISQKIWKYISFNLFDKEYFKELCKYSFPLIPNSFSWWVVGTSDRTIVSVFLGVAVNGVYSVANKFSSLLVIFYNIFNMSWTESVSLHINDEDNKKFMQDMINSMFKLFSCMIMGVIACMPFVFPVMVNKQYNGAYYQIPILMVSILFQIIVGLYSVIYVALKKSVEIAKTSFYAAIINVVVDLLLVKFIGLYAASISTLAAYAAMAIYRYFHVKKYIDIPIKKNSIVQTIILSTFIVVAYYLRNMFLCAIALVTIIVYTVKANIGLIKDIYKILYLRISAFKEERFSRS